MRGSRVLAAATVIAAAVLPASPALAGDSGDNGGPATAGTVTGTGTGTTAGTVPGTVTNTAPGAIPGAGTTAGTVPGTVSGTVHGAEAATGTPLTGSAPVAGTSPVTSPGTSDLGLLRSAPGVAIITSGGGNGSAPDTGFGGALGMNLPETLLGASFIVAGTAAGAYLLRRRRENGIRG